MNKEITGKKKKITIISFIGIIVIALLVVIVLLVSNNNDNSITDEKNSINTAENDTNSINDDNNNNNQVDEEIVNFANKYHYNIDAIAIVNDNSDFRNDNGFELNSIDNVKNATDKLMNNLMISHLNSIEDIKVAYTNIISSSGNNIKDSFHLSAPSCFKKEYIERQSKKYLVDSENLYSNENQNRYYCFTGYGNFGGSRPEFESIEELNTDVKLYYNYNNQKVVISYQKVNDAYKLKSIVLS